MSKADNTWFTAYLNVLETCAKNNEDAETSNDKDYKKVVEAQTLACAFRIEQELMEWKLNYDPKEDKTDTYTPFDFQKALEDWQEKNNDRLAFTWGRATLCEKDPIVFCYSDIDDARCREVDLYLTDDDDPADFDILSPTEYRDSNIYEEYANISSRVKDSMNWVEDMHYRAYLARDLEKEQEEKLSLNDVENNKNDYSFNA